MISTDIIIVFYGDKKELDRCIESIEHHCQDYKIYIQDNNKLNLGFTKGCNEKIKEGNAPYVWLLNQDAVVLKDAQQTLINRFSYGSQVGIVGSLQLDAENQDSIRWGGPLRAFPSGIHKGGYVSMGHCQIPTKITWQNFASAMISRKMINDIGLMDENLFLVYSDSDYCYYARSKGYECWLEPRSRVLHKLNASRTVTEWHQKDMLAFMKKWGITQTPDGKYIYSDLFAKLDTFP